MPLQNRVSPDGSLHAVAARGTMLGNRGGRLHRADRTLGRRRWSSRHWICCELHYKNWHHEPMGTGYTSLFFLDEVTALAAGHRPCCLCRRSEARVFLAGRKIADVDLALHEERLGCREAELAELPDGAMVEWQGSFFAIRGRLLWRWSFQGYDQQSLPRQRGRVRLLTPPTIVSILQAGYQPRWHHSLNEREIS